jgi:hypothetical protein
MSSSSLVCVAAKKAAEVAAKLELGEAARSLLRPDLTPRQYLDLLIQKGHPGDAVRFLAHALPKPEAVWWAIQCARTATIPPAALPPKQVAALAAAERWLQDPSDDNRRNALPAAQEAGVETPPGMVAIGTFFSGGSLAPASVPSVPPGEHLTAAVVAGAIIQGAYAGDSDKGNERLKAFLTKGIEIAGGSNRWPAKR